MKKKLVIFGLRDFAELVYEYFTHDSDYEVIGFTVHERYMPKTASTFCGLPIFPYEHLEEYASPKECYFYAALSYKNMNRGRAQMYLELKEKGYHPASYISSRCFKWHNVKVGEHCFIFEDNTLQPFVEIGNNVILWSGNHIGHSSVIGDHAFVTSHVVVSGFCQIGKNCFLGVNSTLANDTVLGDCCWVYHGSILSGEIPAQRLIKTERSQILPLDEDRLFKKLGEISKGRKYED